MSHATLETKGPLWGGGVKPYGINSKKFGMWLFIVSDAITFGSLIVAYSYVRMATEEGGWPTPFNFDSILLSSVMTFFLLTSSLTMVMAVMAGHAGEREKAAKWIFATMAGGLGFVVLHLWEWNHIIHTHVHEAKEATGTLPMIWGTFFACTGMHMLHVSSGVVYLGIVALKVRAGKLAGIDVEVAGLYWHFVDLVWMFIFPLVYLMSTKI